MKATAHRFTRFQWRATVSVVIASSFAALVLSGVVLFFAPPGRVANWTNWTIAGMTKSDWASLHICFGALFLVATAWHLYFNWRPLAGYFKNRATRAVAFRREWIAGLAFCAGVFAGTRMSLAPFSSLPEWSEALKQRWDDPARRAPIPHAELLTVAELAREGGVELSIALGRLQRSGIVPAEAGATVGEVAAEAGVSAERLYGIVFGRGAGPAGHDSEGGNTDNSEGHGSGQGAAGGGVGWKTVAEICSEEGIDLADALRHLRVKGVEAEAGSTMRDLARQTSNHRPYELLEIIRQR